MYNLHPIFVHFPIAFFLLYSLFAILPFEKWFKSASFKTFKIILLAAGLLGAILATSTGEIAERFTNGPEEVLHWHELFAGTSNGIFIALFIMEILDPIVNYLRIKFDLGVLGGLLKKFSEFFSERWIIILVAIAGVIAISMTGLLGGVLVHGLEADPLAKPILNILGVTI
jgi:uncharacterized membrane protein